MSTNVEDPPAQTAASLVSGILGDLHDLVQQQFQLTRREIADELRVRAAVGAVLALGVGLLFLGAGMFSLASAQWLHWMALPPGVDAARLPLWACHALVATVLVVSGAITTLVGRVLYRGIDSCQIPPVEMSQEHVPWTLPLK